MDVFPGLAHVLSRTPRLQTVHLRLKGATFLPESEIRAVSELNLGLKTGLWGFRSGENRLHQLVELRAHARSEELSCVGLAGLLHMGWESSLHHPLPAALCSWGLGPRVCCSPPARH